MFNTISLYEPFLFVVHEVLSIPQIHIWSVQLHQLNIQPVPYKSEETGARLTLASARSAWSRNIFLQQNQAQNITTPKKVSVSTPLSYHGGNSCNVSYWLVNPWSVQPRHCLSFSTWAKASAEHERKCIYSHFQRNHSICRSYSSWFMILSSFTALSFETWGNCHGMPSLHLIFGFLLGVQKFLRIQSAQQTLSEVPTVTGFVQQRFSSLDSLDIHSSFACFCHQYGQLWDSKELWIWSLVGLQLCVVAVQRFLLIKNRLKE